jgi:hypothetical protein
MIVQGVRARASGRRANGRTWGEGDVGLRGLMIERAACFWRAGRGESDATHTDDRATYEAEGLGSGSRPPTRSSLVEGLLTPSNT